MKRPFLRVSLFWKIFSVFWLSFILIFLFSILSTQQNSDTIHFRQLPPHLAAQIDKQIHRITPLLEKRKIKSKKYQRHLKLLDKKILKRLFLLNIEGADYWNKPIPNILLKLHEKVQVKGIPMSAFKKQVLFYGGQSFKIQNNQYRIYSFQNLSLISRSYFGLFIKEFSHNLLVAIFFVSFPLSLFLAWFFTKPIKALRNAINQMSIDLNKQQTLAPLLQRSDEFGDLARDFESMANQLSHTISSKEQLVRDVSHELKSPLARLQVAVALSEKTIKPEDAVKFERVNQEIQRMNLLINQILDFSKTDVNQYSANKLPLDLKQLIQLLVDDITFEGQQKNIQFKLGLEEHLLIEADKSMIISCLDNILRNALHYATSKVSVIAKQVIFDGKNRIEIVISDDGNGVEESQLEQIFEAFYRPDNHRSRQAGGSGIGLSIAKKVVEFHQGRIRADSLLPQGFKISICFLAHTSTQ
ncbi:MAG: ATP-binding protein [Enterobacterales bacterium]|nr:ATP-binding protein [Enterobacterales bacterium]